MTTAQRHSIYKKVLRLFKTNRAYFICNEIKRISGLGLFGNIYDNFPELLKLKPKNASQSDAWYKRNELGKRKRIAVLEKCIKATAPKSNKQSKKTT